MEKLTNSLTATSLRWNILKTNPASVTRRVTIVLVHISYLLHEERETTREGQREKANKGNKRNKPVTF